MMMGRDPFMLRDIMYREIERNRDALSWKNFDALET
jgi:hypothetical protein